LFIFIFYYLVKFLDKRKINDTLVSNICLK